MSESRAVRNPLIKAIKSWGGHAQAHEDMCSAGIPDVSAALGPRADIWIECKLIKKWPTRARTKIPVRLSIEQVFWLRKRHAIAENCFVLTKIEKEFWLHTACHVEELYQGMNRERFKESACWHGKKLDLFVFLRALNRGPSSTFNQ